MRSNPTLGGHAPAPASEQGVRVEHLFRSYGSNRVLDDVSFHVPDGAVCVLLGSSGSGKTTTLRSIAGLDKPDSGQIWIDGKCVTGEGQFVPAEKREVGLVFQAYALWPHMRVFDQIAYPLRVRGWKRPEIEPAVAEVAAMVGLGELLARYPSELSGGQQQRVALARSLVVKPRVLLLDEPLSNLDAALRRETRLQLQALQKRVGVTTIYVTHDQEEAMAVADIIVVMAEGCVLSIASPRDTYDRPGSPYVASFVGASNLLNGRIVGSDDDYTAVKLSDGTVVKGIATDKFAIGDEAVLAIKPVDVAISTDAGARANEFPAEIIAATYLGSQIELVVKLLNAEWRIPAQRWLKSEAGDAISIHVPPDHVTVLRAL